MIFDSATSQDKCGLAKRKEFTGMCINFLLVLNDRCEFGSPLKAQDVIIEGEMDDDEGLFLNEEEEEEDEENEENGEEVEEEEEEETSQSESPIWSHHYRKGDNTTIRGLKKIDI